jgi:hypothetical protein
MLGHLNASGRKIEHLPFLYSRGRDPVEISRAVQTRHCSVQHDMVWIVDLP